MMAETEETQIFVGVDVGGTSIKIGFVSDAGKILCDSQIETEPDREPQFAIDRIAAEIGRSANIAGFSDEDIVAIGLGTPGTMDIPNGMILEPPNLPGWRHFAIRDALAEATSKPVAYTNDANAAAFGEFWVGTGRNYRSMVLLTLGTGVGGGIIVFGQTIDGVNSHGSEIGHTIVDTSATARMCSCGKRGHLEAYASATAVTLRAHERLKNQQQSTLHQMVAADEKLTALAICQHAERGDDLAQKIILETADYLAVGILNVAHMIDPDAVVLGGAMNFGGNQSPIGQQFIDRIRHQLKQLCLPVIAKRLIVEFASLGSCAGLVGAAGIARNMICNQAGNVQTSENV